MRKHRARNQSCVLGSRMVRMRFRPYALSAAFVLSSCGGGGGGAPIPGGAAALPVSAPTATPAPSPSASPVNTATMTITFSRGKKAAHAKRRPNFISPSSASMKITINSVNGTAPPSWVSPNPDVQNLITSGAGQNCTLGETSETCTLNVQAPPGSVNYTFDLYDGLNAGGSKLGTKTATFTLAQGHSNTLSVGFQGIVNWVSVWANDLTASAATPGQSSSEQMYVSAYDADDNQINSIAGATNFDNPIALSISDPSSATTLSVGSSASCPGSSSVTINAPTDLVWVCYTGETTWGANVTASEAPGGPAGESITGSGSVNTILNSIQLTGTTICDTTAGCLSTDPNYNQPTVFLTLTGAAQAFSASELGWTQAPYNQQFDLSLDATTCGSGASAAVTTTASPATSWTITPQTVGVCKGTITEHSSGGGFQTATVWFSVTLAVVQGFHRSHAH